METPNPIWSIHLFGGLQVKGQTQTLSRFRTRKTASLLAYLALNDKEAHSREKLIELLWPESDRKSGRNSLRVSLNALRQQLESDPKFKGRILLAQGDTVQLNPRYCQTDVVHFQANLRAAEIAEAPLSKVLYWQQAIEQYGGELLPGDPSAWVEQEAKRFADLHLNALCSLSQTLLYEGELNPALSYAHQSVRIDPLCEGCHFLLMQIYAKLNRPARVLQQYNQLQNLWQKEFQGSPSQHIQLWISQFIPKINGGKGRHPLYR